jgi:hypothetical protein
MFFLYIILVFAGGLAGGVIPPVVASALGTRDQSALNFLMVIGLFGGGTAGALLTAWIETLF